MGRKDARVDIREDLVMFCLATGLHGFAYLPQGRNRGETFIWSLTVLASLIGASILCYESFLFWGQSPVINVVETYTYDASLVPMPAITLCPIQHMDELHQVSVMLNQVRA